MKSIILGSITTTLLVAMCLIARPASVFATMTQSVACGGNNVQIPQTVVLGDTGTTSKLVELSVPAELQGKTLSVSAQVTNNTSVHPGTQIIIGSSSSSVVLDDVEGATSKITTVKGQLNFGPVIDVRVKFGNDKVFSGGGQVSITVECPAVTPVIGRGGGDTPQVKETPRIVPAGAGGSAQTSPLPALGFAASLVILGLGIRRFALNR